MKGYENRGDQAPDSAIGIRYVKPGALRTPRLFRSRALTLLVIAPVAIIVSLILVGVWNYFDLSIPLPAPTSNLTAFSNASPDSTGVANSRKEWTVAWEYDAGAPLVVTPFVVDDLAYVVTGRTPESGRLSALDVDNGNVAWERRLDSIADYPPALAGNLVYIGTRAGRLLALDRHTGAEVWTFESSQSILGQPVVEDGVLYFASGKVFALDAATGEPRWDHAVGGGASQPIAYSQGIVVAVSADGNLNLINGSNGNRRLTFRLWFATSAGPVISGETAIVSGKQGNVQAVTLHSRDVPMEKAMRYWWTKLWLWDMAPKPPLPIGYLWQRRDIGGVAARSLPSPSEIMILRVDDNAQSARILALDRTTGGSIWQTPLDSALSGAVSQPGGHLLAGGTNGRVYALDAASGDLVWQLNVGQPIGASPVLADEFLLVPTAGGKLIAYR